MSNARIRGSVKKLVHCEEYIPVLFIIILFTVTYFWYSFHVVNAFIVSKKEMCCRRAHCIYESIFPPMLSANCTITCLFFSPLQHVPSWCVPTFLLVQLYELSYQVFHFVQLKGQLQVEVGVVIIPAS